MLSLVRQQSGPGDSGGHATLEVSPDLPAEWDGLVDPGFPWATRRWLELAPARLPGRPVTITLCRLGRSVLAVVTRTARRDGQRSPGVGAPVGTTGRSRDGLGQAQDAGLDRSD